MRRGKKGMGEVMNATVESSSLGDFMKVMNTGGLKGRPLAQEAASRRKINLDADNVKNGLGQLVLTLVKLLHELLERQAIRRIDAGSLTDQEIERLGYTLMRQSEEIDRLRKSFGLEEKDLNLDLGPLGRLL